MIFIIIAIINSNGVPNQTRTLLLSETPAVRLRPLTPFYKPSMINNVKVDNISLMQGGAV